MKKILRHIIAWLTKNNQKEMDSLAKQDPYKELELEKYRQRMRNIRIFKS